MFILKLITVHFLSQNGVKSAGDRHIIRPELQQRDPQTKEQACLTHECLLRLKTTQEMKSSNSLNTLKINTQQLLLRFVKQSDYSSLTKD